MVSDYRNLQGDTLMQLEILSIAFAFFAGLVIAGKYTVRKIEL